MTAYYNEFDPGAAAWLRELIRAGLIADGDVDERSILDVRPAELSAYTQCHFFAGIGGWSLALRLAGWSDDRPAWTGSPPCQPFSAAGEGKGRDDARHLAPKFISLVGAARPGMLFGEQVASSDVFGKAAKRARGNFVAPPQWAWLDDLSDRLEAARYAVGASDFPSAGVGAPHIRQRTFFGAVSHEWLAQPDSWECDGIADGQGRQSHGTPAGWQQGDGELAAGREFCGLADDASLRRFGRRTDEAGTEPGSQQRPDGLCAAGGLADAGCQRRQQDARGASGDEEAYGRAGRIELGSNGHHVASGHGEVHAARPLNGFWSDADWLLCRDGKWRPVESGSKPLAHGVSGRVGLLRGYGNAINPHAAAQFIKAFSESVEMRSAP